MSEVGVRFSPRALKNLSRSNGKGYFALNGLAIVCNTIVAVQIRLVTLPIFSTLMGLHVPRLAFLPCKERVEGSIPFGSTKNAKRKRNEELVPNPLIRLSFAQVRILSFAFLTYIAGWSSGSSLGS